MTDVRGLGLMAALELVTPELAAAVVQRAFRSGLLLLTAGARAVRLCPPLVLTADEADVGLEILEQALAESRLDTTAAAPGASR